MDNIEWMHNIVQMSKMSGADYHLIWQPRHLRVPRGLKPQLTGALYSSLVLRNWRHVAAFRSRNTRTVAKQIDSCGSGVEQRSESNPPDALHDQRAIILRTGSNLSTELNARFVASH
jgi:hypothetical protein